MISRLLLSMFVTTTLIGSMSGPASAETTLFSKVKDWEIKKDNGDGRAGCMMVRRYESGEDKSVRTVVIGVYPAGIAIAVGDQSWKFEKTNRAIVLLMGGKIVDLHAKWEAEGTQMVGEFSNKILPYLDGADNLVLRFKAGDEEFKIPASAEALAAVKTCMVPPAMPSQARINYYSAALLLQKAAQDCDLATTKKQRTDLDARVAALKPDMMAVHSVLEVDIGKRFADPKTSVCPKPPEAAEFMEYMNAFLTLTPDAFAAFDAEAMRKEEAKKAAAAAPATPAPAPVAPTPAPPAPAVAPAPAPVVARPSETRMKVYGAGLIFQKMIKECDLPTTGKQRGDFDAKLDALVTEMTSVSDEVKTQVQAFLSQPTADLCSTAKSFSDDGRAITEFGTQTPEAFAAYMDAKTAAAREAPAAPKP